MHKQDADLTLSLEMIERDCQDVLNKYLRSEVDEEYLCRIQGRGRIMRAIIVSASCVRQGAFTGNDCRQYPATNGGAICAQRPLGGIDAGDRQYLPQRHIVEQGAYYVKFKNYMQFKRR